ncbi:uncharacterized protein MELLADRAFT_110895 [Melampsora larici-populina 98AG31]|uniref:Uncharacterized protein n=1 Tax=Melampsora larici-populina (strain 98AG31 / pathotype 3-4-7) TaxID=747676 RepID=F4S1C7_MELLP|nr:uncharacterized protein MELLADRAFT_110895 [Melampsora larici-populina 98AG31]EGG01582.1 hypothetical protein MELLADRAFT_110895 [Melampsora larici-populina 98AG31]
MTSWLVYSCKATSDEQKIIKSNIAKISQKNPDSHGDLPFVSAVDSEGVKEEIEQLCEEDIPTAVPDNARQLMVTFEWTSFLWKRRLRRQRKPFPQLVLPSITIAVMVWKPMNIPMVDLYHNQLLPVATGPAKTRSSSLSQLRVPSTPVKSPSPSPQKHVIKASKQASKFKKCVPKGEGLQDIKLNLPILEIEKGVEREIEVKAKVKAKPTAKGRKPKVARV